MVISGSATLGLDSPSPNTVATTLSGVISGAGQLSLDATDGEITVLGDNTHSGATTIAGGEVRVGDGGTTGRLGSGDITNDGNLVFDRSDDLTLANTIGGTGSLSKAGDNTLTLSANSSYSGSTTIYGGVLVLSNNAPTTGTSGFNGPGRLRIEPTGDDFSGTFNTSGWVFGSDLTGLTIGKASSADGVTDANVTLASAITLNGPLTVYGANLVVSAAIDTVPMRSMSTTITAPVMPTRDGWSSREARALLL
jgi:autotransporter-associated beta strand protein